MFHSGFITIVGKPNVGKSTWLNAVMKEKISITSAKPQTTRDTIRGIYHYEGGQMVFIDTPGIHQSKHRLGSTMTKNALATMNSVDVVLYMVSATDRFDDNDVMILDTLKHVKTPKILVINKTDLVKDVPRLEAYIKRFKDAVSFDLVVGISALKGTFVETLLNDLKAYLPEGPPYYPTSMKTDSPKQHMISERIREKILRLTQEEIPHSVMVTVDYIEPDEKYTNVLNIHASIIVERDSQKGILIGKGGAMIKRIGTQAREDILALMGEKIFLDLHVKVIKDWRNKEHHLKQFGYLE